MPHRPRQDYGLSAADLLPIIEGLHGVVTAHLAPGAPPELTVRVDPEVGDHEHRKRLLRDAVTELAVGLYPGVRVRLIADVA